MRWLGDAARAVPPVSPVSETGRGVRRSDISPGSSHCAGYISFGEVLSEISSEVFREIGRKAVRGAVMELSCGGGSVLGR